MLVELIELIELWALCHGSLYVMVIISRGGWLLSSLLSGALESQCRSGLLLSYPTIYNITSI